MPRRFSIVGWFLIVFGVFILFTAESRPGSHTPGGELPVDAIGTILLVVGAVLAARSELFGGDD